MCVCARVCDFVMYSMLCCFVLFVIFCLYFSIYVFAILNTNTLKTNSYSLMTSRCSNQSINPSVLKASDYPSIHPSIQPTIIHPSLLPTYTGTFKFKWGKAYQLFNVQGQICKLIITSLPTQWENNVIRRLLFELNAFAQLPEVVNTPLPEDQ